MTVSAQTPINQSNANGVTTVFPYTFRILDASDLRVDVDGDVKTLGVDYTVSGVGADGGGNVTFVAAPASGVVSRRRAMPLTRETDFQDQGELPAATLDEDLDRAVMLVQQLQEQIDRAIAFRTLPVNFDLALPPPEAGKYLQVRGDAQGLQWSQLLTSGTVSASAYGLTLLNTANAAAARTALGSGAGGDAVFVATTPAAARAAAFSGAPNFRAILSASLFSYAPSGYTTVVFGTESEDVGSSYNAATGEFTAPVDGLYLFAYALSFTCTAFTSAGVLASQIYKGASILGVGGCWTTLNATDRVTLTGTAIVSLTAGEVVTVRANKVSGTYTIDLNQSISSSGVGTYFAGALLR